MPAMVKSKDGVVGIKLNWDTFYVPFVRNKIEKVLLILSASFSREIESSFRGVQGLKYNYNSLQTKGPLIRLSRFLPRVEFFHST